MSRSGISAVGFKDDESKCKEALRGRVVMLALNPPLLGFHWHGLGGKTASFERSFCCLEDEKEDQYVFC